MKTYAKPRMTPEQLQEAQQRWAAEEKADNERKRELIWALRTRILTDDEMMEVKKRGEDLLIQWSGGCSGSYNPVKLEQRLTALLANQFQLRAIAAANKQI